MDDSLGPVRRAVALNVSSTDQVLTKATRAFYASTSANLVCRLVNDTSDTTFTALNAGTVYPFQIIKVVKSGTTVAGLLLY